MERDTDRYRADTHVYVQGRVVFVQTERRRKFRPISIISHSSLYRKEHHRISHRSVTRWTSFSPVFLLLSLFCPFWSLFCPLLSLNYSFVSSKFHPFRNFCPSCTLRPSCPFLPFWSFFVFCHFVLFLPSFPIIFFSCPFVSYFSSLFAFSLVHLHCLFLPHFSLFSLIFLIPLFPFLPLYVFFPPCSKHFGYYYAELVLVTMPSSRPCFFGYNVSVRACASLISALFCSMDDDIFKQTFSSLFLI